MTQSQRELIIQAFVFLASAAVLTRRQGYVMCARMYAKGGRDLLSEFGDRERVTPQLARKRRLEAAA